MMSESIKTLLKSAKTVAVIGCSEDEYRTSHQIAKYLQDSGYRMIPINPNYNRILGEEVYDTLQDVPENVEIDIADIFRNKEFTAEMVDQAVERVETTGHRTAVWTQLDVSSPEAKQKAEEAGLEYIENECMMVQHRQLLG